MKIRIIDNFDYEDVSEGKTYNVLKERPWSYTILDDQYDENEILKEHCEVIEVEDSTEWSGEGLPPVGQKCLAVCTDGDYHEVEIVYVNRDQFVAVFEDPTAPGLKYYWQTVDRFKPIKSEKDKEIDELDAHLDEWFNNIVVCPDNTYDDLTLSQYLYNLGYRKTT